MVSINAYILLQKAATISLQKWDAVSKQEIQRKINEIKYLSSQKKVPRLSLRKEVIPQVITSFEEVLSISFDNTNTGLCFILLKSEKGKGTINISPCSYIIPHLILLIIP